MNEMVMSPPPATRAAHRIRHFLSMLVPSLEEIGEHRPIGPPLAAAWLLSIAAAVVTRPLALGMVSDQYPGAEGMVTTLLAFAALFSPLIVLAKVGVLGGFLWSALVLVNAPQRLRLLASILVYGEVILMLNGLATAVFAHLGGAGPPSAPELLQAPWSLAAHVSSADPMAWMVAQQLSAFHLVWALFIAAAVRRAAGMRLPGALATGALAWAAAIAGAAVRAAVVT